MLISPHSSLRRIPQGLDPKQLLCLDVLRLAGDIADIAYRRLVDSLELLPADKAESSQKISLIISAITDAWTIVDCGHRFGEMIANFPGFHQDLPQFVNWPDQLLRELRNYWQHYRERVVNNSVEAFLPVLGTLTWQKRSDVEETLRKVYVLHPGTYFPGARTDLGSFTEEIKDDIDAVTLHADGRRLCLKQVINEMRISVQNLEENIDAIAGQLPRMASDMVACFELRVGEGAICERLTSDEDRD